MCLALLKILAPNALSDMLSHLLQILVSVQLAIQHLISISLIQFARYVSQDAQLVLQVLFAPRAMQDISYQPLEIAMDVKLIVYNVLQWQVVANVQ